MKRERRKRSIQAFGYGSGAFENENGVMKCGY